jgi:DNA-binding MarR family transcriptional regulator
MPTRARTAELDQEAYNAIITASKVMKHAGLRLFADEGITDSQFLALSLLANDGHMLMRKMSDEMLVTPANVTGIVDHLEEKRLVRRTPVKGDRRATVIQITPEGEALYERVAKKKADLVRKTLSTFTKDERITLHSLLERFQMEMSRSLGER